MSPFLGAWDCLLSDIYIELFIFLKFSKKKVYEWVFLSYSYTILLNIVISTAEKKFRHIHMLVNKTVTLSLA